MLKSLMNLYWKYRNPKKYLVKKGVAIGEDFHITGPVSANEGELITIGNHCNFSFDISFVTHDGSNIVPEHLGLSERGGRKYGKIIIGDNVFIGARTLILPNVRIGNNVIIGAGSVVTHSIPDNSVAAGVPCKVIESLDDYLKKNLPQFISPDKKNQLKEIVPEPKAAK